MSRDTSQAFVIGYQAGHADATRDARVEAFGSIRRAATLARELDQLAPTRGITPRVQLLLRLQADAMRDAIRTAITSSSKRTPRTHRNAHHLSGARDE